MLEKNCLSIDGIDTPALLIDGEVMRKNISRMQSIADGAGIALRPHIKTHKTPELALLQVEQGAVGAAAAKLGEAECMAEHGIKDIQIANQVVGEEKIRRMLRLSRGVRLSCAVDAIEHVSRISQIFHQVGEKMRLLIEVNSGLDRCGLNTMREIVKLARFIDNCEGVELQGVMTHAGHAYAAENEQELRRIGIGEGNAVVDAANGIREAGIACPDVSAGSTPTARYCAQVSGLTELRTGNYIFNDMTQVTLGVARLEECALSVIATVISSFENRLVIDAGSKSLSAERGAHGKLTLDAFGFIPHHNLKVRRLSEEHGIIDNPTVRLPIGSKVEIIPVHACSVVNLFNAALIRDDRNHIREISITARGYVS